MNKTNYFPWHFFVRSIRAKIILIIMSATLTFTICQTYSEYLFPKVLLLVLLLSLLAIIQAYLKITPFTKTLKEIDDIQVQLPLNKKLNIIYQKNEWVLIQEMLKLTEKYIKEQNQLLLVKEQQTNTILKSISQSVIILDSYLNCKQYNEVFEQTFIKTKEIAFLKDEKLWKIFSDESLIDQFIKAKDQSTPIYLKGHQIEKEYFDIAINPVIDEDNNSSGLLAIFHNVTELKLSERMRVDFVANVSHEIRTPLTSIKGFSQLLMAQKDLCPEQLLSPLHRIVDNTERLKDLFDNLLKLSSIESKYGIDIEKFSLSELLKVVSANLKAKYVGKNINIIFSENMDIYGDRKLLEQVFTNLLDNAIKYTTNREPQIKIAHSNEPNQSIILINDNGPGISSKELERIFERFYRVKGPASHSVEGTGLGLSIVKHIINKHNGRILVESEVDKGSCFTISLPTPVS